jgi:hypothetical protein
MTMPIQLTHARAALKSAHDDIDAIRNAKSLDDIRTAWISFLINLNRSFNKAENELGSVPKFQGWNERGRVKAIRANDPLIAYLKNSRHADEHGIAPLALETPDVMEFTMKAGSRGFFIDKIESRVDGYTNVEGLRGDVEVKVTPPKFELVPVVNRGRTYAVPTTHLGAPLPSSKPIVLAETGYSFYLGFVEKAEVEMLN